MSRPWRNFAILLFIGSLLFGGLVGEKLLAVSDETQGQIRLYTELLQAAHESYGAEVEYRDLVYASINGMLRTLDPHTNFLTPEDYEEMRERQQASFFGLGILVSKRNGELTVISPIEGTPAWRLGLRAGDIISMIEGEPTDTMSLDEAVTKLKGPKGTQVNVAITRRGLDEPLQMAITRAEIPQNTVRYAYMMTPDTGYIRLTDFSRSTGREMRESLDKLKGEGMSQLLLDLRSNGGGLLDQTVTVSNFFVPQETRIVETRGRLADSYQTFFSDGTYDPLDIPVVVLVNNGTASAAEILAGAIQDHDVGLVLGTPTWGKGLVQTVYNLSYGSGLALTTAKYYTPSGRLIQRDYSSFYDYYTHFGQEGEDDSAADVEVDLDADGGGAEGVSELPTTDTPPDDVEVFVTDLGRDVYGGGGITPDVLMELPDGPQILTALFAQNAFFDFAVDYHGRHQIQDPTWQPPAGIVDDFRNWVLEEEIVDAEAIDDMLADLEAKEFTQRQIHADIFTSAFGTQASHQVLSEGDAQIQAALELFDEAAALLERRHRLKASQSVEIADTDGGDAVSGDG
ncbi:MAG: S41 family peptidase [Acidobacteriota bacterium]